MNTRYYCAFFVFLALETIVLGLQPAFGDPGRSITEERRATDSIYQQLNSGEVPMPGEDVFARAMAGYGKLSSKHHPNKSIITIIDFTKPSTEKRLWVIDLAEGRILYHTLVAHGRNSGDLYATSFSNKPSSLQSSLGFYFTGATYNGKHGLSLKLRGLEPGINDLAEERAIVMHGADYVQQDYIRKIGRLGRSWGCPALPMDIHEQVIQVLAGGTCLYIYYPDQEYLETTLY